MLNTINHKNLVGVCEFFKQYEDMNPLATHVSCQTQWADSARNLWEAQMPGGEAESTIVFEYVLDFRLQVHKLALSASHTQEQKGYQEEQPWTWLLETTQIEQRTEEWYNKTEFLTASEIEGLWGGPRTRGVLVMSKVPGSDYIKQKSTRLAVSKAETRATDWGIRYEPVVKMLLEKKYNIKITDLGRIHHQINKRLGASPDGLITQGNEALVGRLVEIKCPKSRKIDDTIPKEYWKQMQIQMEVCNRPACEYVEAEFIEVDSDDLSADGIIRLEINKETEEKRYTYDAVIDETSDWFEVEKYGWKLVQLREITISRDMNWFQSIQPIMENFWKDVELARKGEYNLAPPRALRAKKETNFIDDTPAEQT